MKQTDALGVYKNIGPRKSVHNEHNRDTNTRFKAAVLGGANLVDHVKPGFVGGYKQRTSRKQGVGKYG